jgi:hypothetical protein
LEGLVSQEAKLKAAIRTANKTPLFIRLSFETVSIAIILSMSQVSFKHSFKI